MKYFQIFLISANFIFADLEGNVMSIISWTENSSDKNTGVDHLGMRVAAESAYSKLIDFTTTVTWRPRYYSFLCWAARKAFWENGGDFAKPTNTVSHKGYLKTIKKVEYGVVAATLLNDENASQVAGTTRVKDSLDRLVEKGETDLTLLGDHLQSSAGGLSVYGGVMRLLGLLSSSEGFDIPLSHTLGYQLADAFEKSLSLSEVDSPFNEQTQSLDTLKKIGVYCSINGLEQQAQQFEAVREESELIKSVLFDWESFQDGTGRSSRRILSIGLILESRKAYPNLEANLALFREFTLLGAASVNGEIIQLNLPPIYDSVLAEWQMYQAHAYLTYALESGLSLVLQQAKELQENVGGKVLQTDLITRLIENIPEGFQESEAANYIDEFNGWWMLSLSDLTYKLENLVKKGRNALYCEPELLLNIHTYSRPNSGDNFASWVHDTCLLFLMAVIRTRHIFGRYGLNVWVGMEEDFRLVPRTLVHHLDKAITEDLSVIQYAYKIIGELVIKQHHQNALRKLIFQPDKDTAKFVLEGPHLIQIGSHLPGTSSPRYDNALLFLKDLGFLTQEKKSSITPQGDDILSNIRGEMV